MRHLAAFLALGVAVTLLAYVYLSPAYLGDYRWLIIALPASLAVARELYEHSRGYSAQTGRRLIAVRLDPVDDDDDDAETDDLSGLWTGTVRVWPTRPQEVLQVLPVDLLITDEGRQALVILPTNARADHRIAEARILDHNPVDGHLDIQFILAQGDQQRSLEARLVARNRRLVPDDETDEITVELQRAVATGVAI
ncbi:MAG TPA: hypothetical protein VLM89_09510 [Phycisphaerae bacterium]|nr:hypothetical protein [Phycisphaerae bacterium]